MQNTLPDALMAAGVVGAGGAGFPTHIKAQSKAEIVIANGVECEPLLFSDQWLMANHADTIIKGLLLMMKSVGAKRGIVATKEAYTEPIAALRKAILGHPELELQLIGNFYPSGDEFILVYECTGRIIPEGGLPLHVGCVVDNVETLYNAALAAEDKPVIERTVSIVGDVAKPGIFRFPVGTPLQTAVAAAGGALVQDPVVVDGGPMMGKIVPWDGSVCKTTSGLIVLSASNEYILRRTMPQSMETHKTIAICCQCQACTDLCPRFQLGHDLHPHEVMRALMIREAAAPRQLTEAMICCECGICEVVACPLTLSPRNIYAVVKRELQGAGQKNPHRREPKEVRHAYSYTKIPKERVLQRTGLGSYYRHLHYEALTQPVKRLEVLLKQHIGAPAEPVVTEGQQVRKGALLAGIPKGSLGARIHAGIAGTIVAVKSDRIILEARP